MANFKLLARDTAIYGLSSIIGRFLNYLLVPLYTYKISTDAYGTVTNLYAYTALLLVILTFGMETTFFRFANKEGENPKLVFSTILRMVGAVGVVFLAGVFAFLGPLSGAMGYALHPSYVAVMAIIVALDAFQAILFSYLRYKQKAMRFAALKLLFIFLSIGLNLLFFVGFPWLSGRWSLPLWLYDPSVGVGYIFYINLFCTAFVTLFFLREIKGIFGGFDKALMRRMLGYSWPLLLLGVAGILNQTADKILFPHIYPGSPEEVKAQLGIYGAASKIAMIMAMITQAFRYAYEPFVFGSSKEKDNLETYSKGMRYFLVFTLLAFLAVIAYLDILRYIIGPRFWEGLRVVPIVMAAEIMMGVYFNLSFWYKLTDKTLWGAVFAGTGCAVLVAVNLIFVPRFGYIACAWAGVAGYGTAMVLSYLVGQRYMKINYQLPQLLVYVLLAALLFAGMQWSNAHLGLWAAMGVNTLLLGLFCAYMVWKDFRPLLNRFLRR